MIERTTHVFIMFTTTFLQRHMFVYVHSTFLANKVTFMNSKQKVVHSQ